MVWRCISGFPGMALGGLFAFVVGCLWRPRKVARAQEALYATPVAMLLLLLVDNPLVAVSIVTAVVCVLYTGSLVFRLCALSGTPRYQALDESLPEPTGGWPIYTVLVPLYRERSVASSILTQLRKLDYPADKLDAKLLLEADDEETLQALRESGIPDFCEVVIVPDAQPKTKPRACNHGLKMARGEYLVIFDAEDRPEPDQLKKAVHAFAEESEDTVCIQARLGYHNVQQNLLTRWFACEYAVWFGRYLPGLLRLGAPIPLGGTSNHFKTEVLRELDGWDPFNVTEDADLGLRICAHGYRTSLLDSTTWEEANSHTGNWIRQRSRWLKGYIMTHLVWWRNPVRLLATLGPWKTYCFVCSVGGVAFLAMLNIILWLVLGIYAVCMARDLGAGYSIVEILSLRDIAYERWSWPLIYTGPGEDPLWSILSVVFAVMTALLLCANFAFLWIGWYFGVQRSKPSMIIAALLTPLYWVLMSIAAVKACIQAVLRPHYWEKTVHGLDDSAD